MATHGACGEHFMTRWVLGEVFRDETGCHSADDFASFLYRVKSQLSPGIYCLVPIYDVPYTATPTLEDWTAVTAEEIQKLISSAPNKTRKLNSAPTWSLDIRGLLSPLSRCCSINH